MQNEVDHFEIIHNPDKNRFEAWINGHLARLDYMREGGNLIITHVNVHSSLRGHGVAAKMMQAGLEYVRANSLKVIPLCSYAAAYIRRNPQYEELTKQAGN